jgi:hypothetical protein
LLGEHGREAPHSFHELGDGAEVFLENDLLGRGGTDDLGEVAKVGLIPVGLSGVVKAEAQEEGLEAELGGLEVLEGILASAGQVADGFILHGGDIDGGEIAGAQEPSELDGIAAIGLDAVSGFFRYERGSDDETGQAPVGKVAIEDVAARSSLISKHQARGLGLEPPNESVDVALAGADGANEGDLRRTILDDVGDADGILVHIETDEERGTVLHG